MEEQPFMATQKRRKKQGVGKRREQLAGVKGQNQTFWPCEFLFASEVENQPRGKPNVRTGLMEETVAQEIRLCP